MAERLPRYRPLGLRLTGAPRIDFAAAGAAEAAGYQRLSSALDRISSYAFEEAGRRAKIEGEEFGYKLGQNPDQIKTALEAGANVDDIVGDPDTIFGAASRAAVGAQLRVELETDVRSKLAQLSAAIEGGDILDPADVETEIDAITEGHTSLLSQFGSKYARQYRATIGTLAAPVYKSALEQSYKLRNAAIAAKFDAGLESARDIGYKIFNDYQGGQTVIDGQVVLDADAKFDVLSRSIIDEAINTKNPANINRAKEYVRNLRTDAKVNALRKFARENPSDVNLTAGLFGNKTALYYSLDEDSKAKVRDEIRDERAALYRENENNIALSKRKAQTRFYQIQAEIDLLPDYADQKREELAIEAESIAKTGLFDVSQDDLLSLRVRPERPAQPSSQDGIDRVTQRVIESYIIDIAQLNEELAFNNVRGKEANTIRKEFLAFQEAQEDKIVEILQRSKLSFGREISKDVGKYILNALPVIYEMNKTENKKLLSEGKGPELLTQTTQRYIDLKIGETNYNNIVKLRSDTKQAYGKYAPNFNWDNSGIQEVQDFIDRIDTLPINDERKADLGDQLKKLKRMLSE